LGGHPSGLVDVTEPRFPAGFTNYPPAGASRQRGALFHRVACSLIQVPKLSIRISNKYRRRLGDIQQLAPPARFAKDGFATEARSVSDYQSRHSRGFSDAQ